MTWNEQIVVVEIDGDKGSRHSSARIARRAGRAVVVLGVMMLVGLTAPPVVHASVGLTVGSELRMGSGGSCSLGFFASNTAGDRLAVTAGHCAEDAGEKIYSSDGTLIGQVGYWLSDDSQNDLYGVTVIHLNNNAYINDGYFTKFGNPSVGDYVKKYGMRTDKTEGKITSISINPDRTRNAVMQSTLVGLPGDSGSAWVGTGDDGGPMLLGLNIGHTTRKDGGYGYAYGFPIRQIVKLVQQNSKIWGPGFIPTGKN